MIINDWIQTNSVLIVLGVSILLLIYFIIEIIQNHRIIKRRLFKRQRIAVSPLANLLIILGYIFFIYIVFSASEIKRADWAQILLMIGLVTITAVYASSTQKIAKETKEQRYAESLPLLVPDIIRGSITAKTEPNEVEYRTLQTGVGIEVIWHNLGKGVAINSRFSFWSAPLDSHPGKVLYFPPSESTFLKIGGRKEIKIEKTWVGQWYDIPKAYHPRLEAEYQDIYERKITTVQEFHIDEEAKTAFLGDLYFTVNGKRLGEELTQHDS